MISNSTTIMPIKKKALFTDPSNEKVLNIFYKNNNLYILSSKNNINTVGKYNENLDQIEYRDISNTVINPIAIWYGVTKSGSTEGIIATDKKLFYDIWNSSNRYNKGLEIGAGMIEGTITSISCSVSCSVSSCQAALDNDIIVYVATENKGYTGPYGYVYGFIKRTSSNAISSVGSPTYKITLSLNDRILISHDYPTGISFEHSDSGNGYAITSRGSVHYYENYKQLKTFKFDHESSLPLSPWLYDETNSWQLARASSLDYSICQNRNSVFISSHNGVYEMNISELDKYANNEKKATLLLNGKNWYPSQLGHSIVTCMSDSESSSDYFLFAANLTADSNSVIQYKHFSPTSKPEGLNAVYQKMRLESDSFGEMVLENENLGNGLFSYLDFDNSFSNDDKKISIQYVPYDKYLPVDNYLKVFKDSISQTTHMLSISTLWFNPGNRQEEILRTELQKINDKAEENKPIRVVIIYSNPPEGLTQNKLTPTSVLNYLSITNPSSYFQLEIYRYLGFKNIKSFNHSKVIAVDNDKLISGGINFVDDAYDPVSSKNRATQGNRPVHDLSLALDLSTVALLGHNYVREVEISLLNTISDLYNDGDIEDGNFLSASLHNKVEEKNNVSAKNIDIKQVIDLIKKFPISTNSINLAVDDPVNDFILGLGKLSDYRSEQQKRATVSEIAIIEMMYRAEKEINIAQQSFKVSTPFGDMMFFHEIAQRTFSAIAHALSRNVRVRIILSAESDVAQGYGDVCSIPSIFNEICTQGKISQSLIGEYISKGLLDVRRAGDRFDTFDTDFEKIRQHAKLIMVDNQIYVGSENLYYNQHSEYGILINSKNFVERFKNEYWNPAWLKTFRGILDISAVREKEYYFLIHKKSGKALEAQKELDGLIVRNEVSLTNPMQLWNLGKAQGYPFFVTNKGKGVVLENTNNNNAVCAKNASHLDKASSQAWITHKTNSPRFFALEQTITMTSSLAKNDVLLLDAHNANAPQVYVSLIKKGGTPNENQEWYIKQAPSFL